MTPTIFCLLRNLVTVLRWLIADNAHPCIDSRGRYNPMTKMWSVMAHSREHRVDPRRERSSSTPESRGAR